MDATAMSLAQHERGIHVVSVGPDWEPSGG